MRDHVDIILSEIGKTSFANLDNVYLPVESIGIIINAGLMARKDIQNLGYRVDDLTKRCNELREKMKP